MQVSAYVGLKRAGFLGAVAAYVGFGLPAFVTMLALSALYKYGHDIGTVQSLLVGLQAIVVVIVLNAAISFGRTSVTRWWQIGIVAGSAVVLIFRINPIFVLLGAAVVGVVLPATGRPSGQQMGAAVTRRKYHVRPLIFLLVAAAIIMTCLLLLARDLFSLALTMLRIDLFTFGGGLGSLPLMQHEFVEVHHWVDANVFLDGIALGQVTPGPIVVTATFVGFLLAGFVGAVVATLAIFFPSFVILIAVESHLDRVRKSRLFDRAVHGMLLAFVGLLLAMTVRFGVAVPWAWGPIALAAAAFVALRLKVDVLWVVLAGAAAALLLVH